MTAPGRSDREAPPALPEEGAVDPGGRPGPGGSGSGEDGRRPWSRAERLAVLLLALVTVVGRLVVVCADPDAAMESDFLQDDSFYYLEIADNVARGRGFTFDGEVPTNGFSPLFLLSLVPITAVSGDDLVLPIRLAGVLQTLLALATGLLLHRLGRRLCGPWCGIALLGTWAVSPYFIAHTVNTMDTGSAALCAVLLLLAHTGCGRGDRGVAEGRRFLSGSLSFGAAAGLALLARIDLGFLVCAVALDWIVAAWRRRGLVREAPSMALAALVAVLVWGSWGVTSRLSTGAWFSTAGPGGREIALQYGWAHLDPVWPRDAERSPFFDTDEVPWTFDVDVATKGLAVFLLESPILALARLEQPFLFWPKAVTTPLTRWFYADLPGRWGALLAVLVLAGACCVPWRRRPAPDRRLGLVALVFFALTLWGYTFHATTHWFFSRYMVPLVLVCHVAVVAALARGLGRLFTGAGPRVLGLATLLVPLVAQFRPGEAQPWGQLLRRDVGATGFVRAWERLNGEPGSSGSIGPDERIGAFQAGALAWFSQRDVVNLDGKVNPAASRALHDGRMQAYIEERGVDLLVDWNWIVYCLYLKELPPGAPLPLRLVQEPTTPLEPSVFRVLR